MSVIRGRRYRVYCGYFVLLLAALSAIRICYNVIANRVRRENVTDPALLSQIALADLNDAELETLVRAAFREAKGVKVTIELPTRRHKTVTITDRAALNALADSFRIGTDQKWPTYSHPGLTYARVEFDGPYRPDFSVDTPDIRVTRGRKVHVQSTFARRLGGQLGLKHVPNDG